MSMVMVPVRVMSRSVVLLQLRTVLISIAYVTSAGHADIRGLYCHLKPCWCPGSILMSLICVAPEAMLMFLTCAATEGYDGVCGSCCSRRLC
jgi:hypothetical protein